MFTPCIIEVVLVVPSHAVQSSLELVLRKIVLCAQDAALLQRHRHASPVLGTLAACEPQSYNRRQSCVYTKVSDMLPDFTNLVTFFK